MPTHPAEYLIHIANLLFLISYSVRDILWLRWFAVAGGLTSIPFFLVQATILWPPVLWAVIFMTMNLYHIWRLYLERRPVVLSADEQRLYDLGFTAIRPREFLSLAMVGTWTDAPEGKRMLTAGERTDDVCVAIEGTVEMSRDGRKIGELAPGQLIGVTMMLTGEPSPTDAHFATPGRYIRWSRTALRTFLDRRPELRTALLSLAKQDIARKLYAEMAGRVTSG